jgi:hypothetical protein
MTAFDGHAALDPVQYSATSHSSVTAARHTVVLGLNASAGQSSLMPLQNDRRLPRPWREPDR